MTATERAMGGIQSHDRRFKAESYQRVGENDLEVALRNEEDPYLISRPSDKGDVKVKIDIL